VDETELVPPIQPESSATNASPLFPPRPARTGPPVRLGLCSGKNRKLLKIEIE